MPIDFYGLSFIIFLRVYVCQKKTGLSQEARLFISSRYGYLQINLMERMVTVSGGVKAVPVFSPLV